jgi:hypothetical protein
LTLHARSLAFYPGLALDALLALEARRLAAFKILRLTLNARRLPLGTSLTLNTGRLTLGAGLRLLGLALCTATAMVAARTGSRGSRNRQRGNAGGEEQPGHHKFSFRTARTARTAHRSHR